MTFDQVPLVGSWYARAGQLFQITRVDLRADAVTIEYFDGTTQQRPLFRWEGLELQACPPDACDLALQVRAPEPQRVANDGH